jgi:hypothetical protein
MKVKNFVVTAILILALPLVLGLAGWVVQAMPAATFPAPSGTSGTIVSISGDFLWVKTGNSIPNRPLHLRVDASTVILKGEFSSITALRVGDAVVIDPTFSVASGTTSTNAVPGAGSSPGAPASTGTGDSHAGRAGASGNSGPGTTAPGPGQEAQPSTPAQPAGGAAPGRPRATSPGSTANTQSQTPIAGQPGHPAARTPIRVARLIWVPQKGEILTSGSVKSTTFTQSLMPVTLQAGSSTFTALVDSATALRRVDTTGGHVLSATAADIQPGKMLLILGTAAPNSDTITARAILVQPPSPGTRATPR